MFSLQSKLLQSFQPTFLNIFASDIFNVTKDQGNIEGAFEKMANRPCLTAFPNNEKTRRVAEYF